MGASGKTVINPNLGVNWRIGHMGKKVDKEKVKQKNPRVHVTGEHSTTIRK